MGARRLRAAALAGACLLLLDPAFSAETKTYTYDAQGRLVATSISGGPAAGTQATTTFDLAGNRTNYSVTPGAGAGVIFAVAGPGSVAEGATATFTVTRSGTTSSQVTVQYATANGSAVAPGDYTASSGTLTFAAGETAKSVVVQTVADSVADGAEQFSLQLSSPSAGAQIDPAIATVTIDQPFFSISGGAAVVEGASAIFTITKTGSPPAATSVVWTTANGSAVSGADFVSGSQTVSFAAGETSKTISVATVDDGATEPAEAFYVNLSSPSSGMALGTSSASATINDMVVFSISSAAAVIEGGTAVFTATKSGTATGPLAVNFASSDGSAVANSDYSAASGQLLFQAAETSKTISVSTIEDSAAEPAETFTVSLSSPSAGSRLGTASAGGTINDMVVFSISSAAAVNEGGTAVFTVTKSGTATGSLAVNFTSSDGSAVASSDYSATSGQLLFQAAETSKTISVSTIADTAAEPAETFTVSLSSPSAGSRLGTANASGTINASSGPNQPPVTQNDGLTMNMCEYAEINVVANDSDPEGDPIELIDVSQPIHGGSVFLVSTTTIGFQPAWGYDDDEWLTYTIKDSHGNTDTGTLSIQVNNNGSACT